MKAGDLERLRAENAALRETAVDLHWMARRYCDGRSSYAPSLLNDHTRTLVALGLSLNPTGDGTIWARDGMGRRFDHLTPDEAAQGSPPEWLRPAAGENALPLERDVDDLSGRVRRLVAAVRQVVGFFANEAHDKPSIAISYRHHFGEALATELDELAGGESRLPRRPLALEPKATKAHLSEPEPHEATS